MAGQQIKIKIAVHETGLDVIGPDGFLFTQAFSGPWEFSTPVTCYIQTDINHVLIRLEKLTADWKTGIAEDDIELHITEKTARDISGCAEYWTYRQGAPDALGWITDAWNPNRKYNLTPQLYGLFIKIEGVRYPNPELMRMVRELDESILAARDKFIGDAKKLLMQSTADESPHVVPKYTHG